MYDMYRIFLLHDNGSGRSFVAMYRAGSHCSPAPSPSPVENPLLHVLNVHIAVCKPPEAVKTYDCVMLINFPGCK